MLKITKDIIANSTENITGLDYKSKLGEDLTNIFRKAITFVNKNTNDKKINNKKIKSLTDSLNELYKNVIEKAILKDIGLKIDFNFINNDIAYTTTIHKSFMLYHDIDQLVSFGNKSKYAKVYGNDYKKYDIDLGKFIKSPVANELGFAIYFSVKNLLFNYLIYEIDNTNIMMTAEEATAITLHEIGHCFSIITGMIYNGYTSVTTTTRLEELRSNFKRTGDSNSFFDKLIKDLDNDLYNLPDTANEHLINETKRFRKSKNISEEGIKMKPSTIYITKIYINLIIIIITFIKFTKLFDFFVNDLGSSGAYSLFKMFKLNSSLYGDKNSRSILTNRNVYMNERWADEYASKMGYGEEITNALMKITKVYWNFNIDKEVNKMISENLSLIGILNIQKKCFNFLGRYEVFEDRISRLVQNNIAFLKKNNISDEIKKEILAQNYQIKLIIKKINQNKRNTFISKIMANTMFSEITDMLISKSPLSDYYEKMFNEIDDLMNNPIYEASYKVKNLVDKLSA